MNKDIRITFRVTPEDHERIRAKAEQAHMSVSAYVRAAALRHKVVVVDGLKEHTHELKGIGRSLNQLAILAHEGASPWPTWTASTPRWRKTTSVCAPLRVRSSADGDGDIHQIRKAIRRCAERRRRVCVAEGQDCAGGRAAAHQRTELHPAAGRAGIPHHPRRAPQGKSRLVLSLCAVLRPKRAGHRRTGARDRKGVRGEGVAGE